MKNVGDWLDLNVEDGKKIVNNPKISSLSNWMMPSIALAHWEEASHERKQFSFEHCELEVPVG